ncbi:MAG TPA: amino acid ABC transporter ATP-binding protein [Candidatus Eisenbergiella merdavium]|uniref:Amino acid ABC transporter ATP-binding protein n=2 Tax=Eisenbergiella TaxID=1432051 RepID=A0A9D2SEI5_9FIRM|nr:amino acid ABC transporter ATP-binding protein [Candidatus Eisenbergiella merdigallinarum]HJC22308.1 amino acid ABC transporter ATP-binding protein [Candidatus Eisenbergiella merdavium]
MDEKKCVLRVRGLEKSFDGEVILRGIDLDVYQGDVISVIGPSGSGKSTLIRCIDFLEEPDRGAVILDGTDYADTSASLKQLHEKVGMVFQSFNLFANRTVLENCTLPLITVRRLDRRSAKDIALKNLEKVGMASFLHRRAAELSGGQKQRTAIARALCMEPRLMLFDEPTSALDPEMVGEVLEVIRSLAQKGTTMIVVSHEMSFVRSISTRVLFLEKGVIEEDAPPQQIFTHPRSERVREFLSRHISP